MNFGRLLVVCATSFHGESFSHLKPYADKEKVRVFREPSGNYDSLRGLTFDTVIFAGFSESFQPSDKIIDIVRACIATSRKSSILFTDGEIFKDCEAA